MRSSARPFSLDLGLALGILCAWLALSGFEPLIAAATNKLRLVVTTGAYRLQWPLGPAAFGVAGLVLAWLRYRFFPSGPQLQERLQRATLLAAALLALRLLALCDPLTYFFPFLTLLWSPHALWAVALVFFGYVHLPTESGRVAPRTDAYIAAALLVLCLPLYFLYALYFCQITMLHGDEGQYLRVAQSLLHDGDMDLANNLGAEHTGEFHVREFEVHKAPASPEGKVHSVHPIGLSVGLVPAYWWGLTHWENPRLASALFMVLLASLCVPLIFLYLMRLGAERWAALLATGIMALTGPFFHYTNQLYPEIPALLVALVTLLALAHWQVPGGSYRSLGRWEVPLLGVLTLLLCGLPFLHPRYTPLGLLCGTGVLLQAWHSPRRRFALSIVGLVIAAGLYPSSPSTTPLAATGWGHSVRVVVLGPKVLSIWPFGPSPCPAIGYMWTKASSTVRLSISLPCSACWPSPACATDVWLLPLASMPLLPLLMVCTQSGGLVSAFLPASS